MSVGIDQRTPSQDVTPPPGGWAPPEQSTETHAPWWRVVTIVGLVFALVSAGSAILLARSAQNERDDARRELADMRRAASQRQRDCSNAIDEAHALNVAHDQDVTDLREALALVTQALTDAGDLLGYISSGQIPPASFIAAMRARSDAALDRLYVIGPRIDAFYRQHGGIDAAFEKAATSCTAMNTT